MSSEPQVVKTPREVAQGQKNVGVRYVLIGGVALVVVAFVIVFLVMR
jgi:hypothetical protein